MKKIISVAIFMVFGLSVLLAAGQQEVEVAAQGPVEFTLTTYIDHYKDGFKAVVESINNNPELNVNLTVDAIAGGSQGGEILKLRFASNEIADFLETNGVGAIISGFGVKNGVVPIEGEWTKNFDTGLLSASTYTYDGDVRGVPFGGVNVGGMLYNMKIFSDLELDIPKTHAELLDVCEEIKKAGITPVYVSGKDTWTLQIYGIVGFSREWLGNDGNATKIVGDVYQNKRSWTDVDKFWDSLAKYKELIDNGYVNETWLADTYDMAQEALANGTAAMYPMASWVFADLENKFPEKVNNIGSFAIPFEGNNHAPAWAPFAFMMTNNCKDLEVGQKVIEYVGSKVGQQVFFDTQPGIPASKGLNVNLLPGQSDFYDVFSVDGRGGLIYQALLPTTNIPKYNVPYADIVARVLTNTTTIEEEKERLADDYVEAGKTQGIKGF